MAADPIAQRGASEKSFRFARTSSLCQSSDRAAWSSLANLYRMSILHYLVDMMIDQFTSYSTKLERLSDDELHCSAEKLVLVENRTIAKLITHLAEMSSRKTALKLGYKNLYEYCITGLNLSEGAVPARIHVANVSRRFPELLIALAESRISGARRAAEDKAGFRRQWREPSRCARRECRSIPARSFGPTDFFPSAHRSS